MLSLITCRSLHSYIITLPQCKMRTLLRTGLVQCMISIFLLDFLLKTGECPLPILFLLFKLSS